MASRESPSTAVCSRLNEVMMATSAGTARVASSRPPNPVSISTTRTDRRAATLRKMRKVASKNVSEIPVRLTMS